MAQTAMREVVLTEDDDPDVGATPPSHRWSGAESATRVHEPPADVGERTDAVVPRRRRRWPAAVVVLGVLVGGMLVGGRTDPDAAARLADDPTVLDDVGAGVQEAWRLPVGIRGIFTIWDDLGVAGEYVDDVPMVMAYDTTAGDLRWAHPVPGTIDPGLAHCETLGSDGTGRSSHVGCRLVTTAPTPGDGSLATTARLLVMDARTGRTVRERPLTRSLATFAPLGPDLVVADVRDDRTLEVTREDTATGRARWTWQGQGPVPHGMGLPRLEPGGGVLAADGPSPFALSPGGSRVWSRDDLPEGRRRVVGDDVDVTGLPGGLLAVTGVNYAGTTFAYGAVWDTDGRALYRIPGPVLVPAPDDGSADDVVLTVPWEEGDVVALDRRTGVERWRIRTGPVGSSVLLDRRLVVNTMTEVLAVDTRSGAVLWRRSVLSESDQLFSDGRVVVLPINEQGSHTLTALDATDGRVRWTVPAPDHVQEWTSSGGLLFALRTDDVLAFGPP